MSPSRPQRVPPGSRPRRDGPAPSQCHLGNPQPPRGDTPGPGALAGCPRHVPSSLASVGGSVAAGILRAPDYCSGGGSLGSGVTASYFHSAAPTATGWGGAGPSPTPAPSGLHHSPALHVSAPRDGDRAGRWAGHGGSSSGKNRWQEEGSRGWQRWPSPSRLCSPGVTGRAGRCPAAAQPRGASPLLQFPGGHERHPECHCPGGCLGFSILATRIQVNPGQDPLPSAHVCPNPWHWSWSLPPFHLRGAEAEPRGSPPWPKPVV